MCVSMIVQDSVIAIAHDHRPSTSATTNRRDVLLPHALRKEPHTIDGVIDNDLNRGLKARFRAQSHFGRGMPTANIRAFNARMCVRFRQETLFQFMV